MVFFYLRWCFRPAKRGPAHLEIVGLIRHQLPCRTLLGGADDHGFSLMHDMVTMLLTQKLSPWVELPLRR